ncbi:Renin [Manis pentadactyla]|nr:Renin [Manis pentadactyla]
MMCMSAHTRVQTDLDTGGTENSLPACLTLVTTAALESKYFVCKLQRRKPRFEWLGSSTGVGLSDPSQVRGQWPEDSVLTNKARNLEAASISPHTSQIYCQEPQELMVTHRGSALENTIQVNSYHQPLCMCGTRGLPGARSDIPAEREEAPKPKPSLFLAGIPLLVLQWP